MSKNSSSSFICKYENCNKYFKEPIMLPCGRSICQEHVTNLINKAKANENSNTINDTFFKCNLCQNDHLLVHEYHLNVNLKEVMDQDFHLIANVNDKHADMRKLLLNFQSTLDELVKIQDDPESYLNEFMSEQKQKVELQRQELKSQIDSIADDIIKKIDDLNQMSLQNINQLSKININKYKSEVLNYQDVHLRDPTIANFQIKQLTNNLDGLNKDAQSDLNRLKRKLQNDTIVEFDANPKKLKLTDFGSFIHKPDVELSKLKELHGHKGVINCAIYYPDNKLITGSDDKSIKIWNLNTAECMFTFDQDNDKISKLLLTSDNKKLIGSTEEGSIKVFCMNRKQCVATMGQECTAIGDLCLTNEGNLISSDSASGVKVWNMETYECMKKLPEEMRTFEKMICLKDGKIAGSISCNSNVIVIFNLETNDEEFRFPECPSFVNCLEIMSNNETLISGHIDGVRLWDMNKAQLIKTIVSDLSIRNVKLIQNDKYLLVNSDDYDLFLCDINNETENHLNKPINNNEIVNLCSLLPNENLVALNGFSVVIYDTLFKKN